MSSAILTSPPTGTFRVVVGTDVASYILKWHPQFAPPYARIVRGFQLIASFMTLAEMRQGALEANWGQRKTDILETYLSDFEIVDSDDGLCSAWAAIRNESLLKGHQISSADAWIATAACLSAPLVTNNTRHYRHLNRLQLVSAPVH